MLSGRLTWEEFVECCEYFIEISENFQRGWTEKGLKNVPGDYHLSCSCMRKFSQEKISGNQPSSENLEQLISSQYDIVYSLSFAVPVIYFNMSHSSGRLLSLDEIWCLFTDNNPTNELWSILTQQDHPILNMPFYMIHPCNTEKIIGDIQQKSPVNIKSYLISWLSLFGPRIGIPLCNGYADFLS